MDLVLIYTPRSKPRRKQNDIILSHLITSEDTEPINTLLCLRAIEVLHED